MHGGIMRSKKFKTLLLDKSYDLYLSMTWPPFNGHGISGHLYEIIDYYLFLHDKMNVGILICEEDITLDIIIKAIQEKYTVCETLLEKIKKSITFCIRPRVVKGRNILFVDGGIKRSFTTSGVILMFDNIFTFRCSKQDTHHDINYNNIILLQDQRVYNDLDSKMAINYIKKINFDSYKKIDTTKTDTALIYATKNCRSLTDEQILNLKEFYKFKKYIILTNFQDNYREKFKFTNNIEFPDLPVTNIFQKFDTYIYTPTRCVTMPESGCFDCSPRFIVECKFYQKDVIYHDIDDDYLKIDTGLKWRRFDITNNFDSLKLKHDDDILDILQRYI